MMEPLCATEKLTGKSSLLVSIDIFARTQSVFTHRAIIITASSIVVVYLTRKRKKITDCWTHLPLYPSLPSLFQRHHHRRYYLQVLGGLPLIPVTAPYQGEHRELIQRITSFFYSGRKGKRRKPVIYQCQWAYYKKLTKLLFGERDFCKKWRKGKNKAAFALWKSKKKKMWFNLQFLPIFPSHPFFS